MVVIPVKEDIERITKEEGPNLNFSLFYRVDVKVRDKVAVSILWKREVKALEHIYHSVG